MKRYIRTKNGKIYDTIEDERIRLERNDKTHEIIFLLLPNTNTCDMPICLNVIAQADTIEELCDEIVIKRYDEPTPCNSPIGKSKSWKAYQPIVKEVEAIYGSIWVDGNLLKAAQMNEKGELELL